MATLNPNYAKLGAGYLFPEIARRTAAFQREHQDAKILKLGIGNTTEPIGKHVGLKGFISGAIDLMDRRTYTGYGAEQGNTDLREVISEYYDQFGAGIDPDEVFVSDGAKPDSANIQSIFGLDNIVAVQDPAYPVYVDTNVIAGRSGAWVGNTGQYEGIRYLPCTEENGFFPSIGDIREEDERTGRKLDLIYLCSPNNPTGHVATKNQLKSIVDYANEKEAGIIYDAAYSAFISDYSLPRSIYEIEEAKGCAIEIQSLSKSHGFTGCRLGWSVVPNVLTIEDSEYGEVNKLWNRRQSTFFNGASNIVQAAGLVALSEQGMEESQELVNYYMENARIIRQGLLNKGLTVFGGQNAPYVWMKTPNGMSSLDFFDELLKETHVVGTPGSGFGPSGEGYFRLSAFGHREDVEEAVDRIKTNLVV